MSPPAETGGQDSAGVETSKAESARWGVWGGTSRILSPGGTHTAGESPKSALAALALDPHRRGCDAPTGV